MQETNTTQLKSRFFDLSLDLLCLLDANGHIKTVNPAFTTVFGKRADDLTDSEFLILVCEEDHQMAADVIDTLANVNDSASFACRMRCHDDTIKWYIWTIYADESRMFHAVGRDITPYKEMEHKEDERNIFAEALLDTVFAINSSLSLEQVLERILSNVGKVVAYDYVNIMLVEGQQAEIVGVQFGGDHPDDIGNLDHHKFDIHHNDYLRAMYQTHESIIVGEVAQPPVWMTSPRLSASGSFLGAPIIVEDVVIGFLGVFNVVQEYFTPLHAQHLITFANQAGSAIQNARLYEQAQTAAVLKERQRMAQELHDSLNQNLFAASTYADLLPKAVTRKPEVVERYAADISRLVRGAVAQMRMILIELHPDALIKTDLSILIKQQCDAFSSHTGISVHYTSNQHAKLNRDDQIAIYRIVQESLHNIDKHAQATSVQVHLTITKDTLELSIKDNGIGFDMNQIGEMNFGVRGMVERAEQINAQMDVVSQPQQGTKITLRKEYYAKS